MIITKSKPFTADDIKRICEQFDPYVKTVIDIKKHMCSAGMDRHYEGEQILLSEGSSQHDIWGGGIDLETKEIDFNSFINIRPRDNNPKNEIQSEAIKKQFTRLMNYFFPTVL